MSPASTRVAIADSSRGVEFSATSMPAIRSDDCMMSTTAARFDCGSIAITRASPVSRGMISAAARRHLAVEMQHDQRSLHLALAELVERHVRSTAPPAALSAVAS